MGHEVSSGMVEGTVPGRGNPPPLCTVWGGAGTGALGSPSLRPVQCVLAGVGARSWAWQDLEAKGLGLLCPESQPCQACVAGVPVHVRQSFGSVGGAGQAVEVLQGREPGHGGCCHPRERGLWGEGTEIHSIEELEAFAGEGAGLEALGGPAVVGVAIEEVFIRAPRQTVQLGAEAPLAQPSLQVPLLLPPLGSAVLKPDLERERERMGRGEEPALSSVSQQPTLQLIYLPPTSQQLVPSLLHGHPQLGAVWWGSAQLRAGEHTSPKAPPFPSWQRGQALNDPCRLNPRPSPLRYKHGACLGIADMVPAR